MEEKKTREKRIRVLRKTRVRGKNKKRRQEVRLGKNRGKRTGKRVDRCLMQES